jgi:hypothetical protein
MCTIYHLSCATDILHVASRAVGLRLGLFLTSIASPEERGTKEHMGT